MNRDSRQRVLFVCIGNACRSQMAEAFARAYGSDVIVPASAGLGPAPFIAPATVRAMSEKNIDIREHFPKALWHLGRSQFDLVVNMSGSSLPGNPGVPVREWDVADPVLMDYQNHCAIRDQIERMVMNLILELRSHSNSPAFRGQGSAGESR